MIHRRLKHRFEVASQHELGWLTAFGVLTWATQSLVSPFHGFNLMLPQGGILLAALLMIPFKGEWQRLRFLALAGLLDATVRIGLIGTPPLASLWVIATLLGQARLGAWLLLHLAPQACRPDTQRGLLDFTLCAGLVPAALSSGLAALATYPAPGEYAAEWLWWFVQRLSALLLLAPLLLLSLRQSGEAHRPTPPRTPALEAVLLWLLCCGAAAAAFSISNPAGQALATYSFLLTPLLVIVAIRLPLVASLFVVLCTSLVAVLAEALSAGDTHDSLTVLSLFMLINLMIVWLLGALIDERRRALSQAQKMRDMYEMLSHINQTLVNLKLTPAQLFERTCTTITQETAFSQACITADPAAEAWPQLAGAGLLPGSVCVRKGNGVLPPNTDRKLACQLERRVMREGRHHIQDSCQACPALAHCPLKAFAPGQGALAAFPIRAEGKATPAVLTIFNRQGRAFDADMVRLFNEMAGNIAFAMSMLEDRQRLKLTSEVFEHSHESIIIADAGGHILDVNPSFTRITGHSRDAVIGQNPRVLQSGRQDKAFYQQLWQSLLDEGYWAGEFWNRRRNGELYPQRGTITAVRGENAAIEHFIAVMEDVSERVQAEEQLHHLANYDTLTGLPNRLLLESRFRQVIDTRSAPVPTLAVLFIDLDEFKHVNDAMGHPQGDRLLRQVADRLRSELRDGDTLARFGGDEFVVLMEGDREEARALAKRLIRGVRRPYQLGEQQVHIGCSIGVAQAPGDGTQLDELIQAADTAMYQAKARGRGAYVFYAASMQHLAQTRLTLRGELNDALRGNELHAWFQPKVCIADGRVVGFEALVRWQHPQRGMVSPGEFIPLAESSGQIVAIDRWMLRTVIAQLARWQQQGRPPLPVAVNVSASLFSRANFVAELAQWLENSTVPPQLLELEVTEHVAMLDLAHTLSTLRELKQLGVTLSIDDFGTGYSGLSYLRDFPIDTVKIDMSFVQGVQHDRKKQAIVRAIIALASTLELRTVAEGVETEEELTFLAEQGCWGYQGYLCSPAVAAESIEQRYLTADPPR